MKPKNKKTRNFSFTTYIDMEEVKSYCQRENVLNYAIIRHDKDVYEEDIHDENGNLIHEKGDPKEPHIHFVVTFKNARYWTSVCRDFVDYEQNTMCQAVTDLESALSYLTHRGYEGKYLYPRECVQSTYGYFRGDYSSAESDNIALRIITDLENGKPFLDMVREYGREFVIHRKSYVDAQNLAFGREIDEDKKQMYNYICQLEQDIQEREKEIKELQFKNKTLERSVMRKRCIVMTTKSGLELSNAGITRELEDECPF